MADTLKSIWLEARTNNLIRKLNHKKEKVQQEAISALTAIGSPAVVYLIKALREGDQLTRANSALVLGRIKDKQALKPLLTALTEDNPVVADSAGEALVALGLPALKSLITLVETTEGETKRRVLKVLDKADRYYLSPKDLAIYHLAKEDWDELVKIGEPAVGVLIKALNTADAGLAKRIEITLIRMGITASSTLIKSIWGQPQKVRQSILRIIEKVDFSLLHPSEMATYYIIKGDFSKCLELRESAITPLIKALEEKDELLIKQAEECLIKLGSLAVEPLLKALKVGNRKVKSSIARILGGIKDIKATETLIVTLNDLDKEVRKEAALALCSIGEPKAIPYIIKSLPQQPAEIKELLVKNLKNMGEAAIEPLAEIIKGEERDELKEFALSAISEIKSPKVFLILKETLESSREKLKEKAVLALGNLGSAEAVEPLIKVLLDAVKISDADGRMDLGGWQMGYNAAISLGKIGDKRALSPLMKVLLDEKYLPKLQSAAAIALGELGDKSAVPALIRSIDNKLIQREVIIALGKLKDKRALPVLIKYLHDPNYMPNFKRTVIEALGNIEQKEIAKELLPYLKESALITPVLEALVKLCNDEVIPSIVEFIENPQTTDRHRKEAILVLIKLSKPQLAPFILEQTLTLPPKYAYQLIQPLASSGQKLTPLIKSKLAEVKNIHQINFLYQLLAELKEKSATEVLIHEFLEEFPNFTLEQKKLLLKALLISSQVEVIQPLISFILKDNEQELKNFLLELFRSWNIHLIDPQKLALLSEGKE